MDSAGPLSGHEFGELLTKRAKSFGQRLQLGVLTLVLGWPGIMFVIVAFGWFATPAGGTPISGGARVVCALLGLLLLWGAWHAFRATLSVFHYHEFGATRSMLGRVMQSVAYDRVEAMWYGVTRHYMNGIYTGTDVELELLPIALGARKAKKLRFAGKHREKPDGVLSRTFLAKNFKGEDELDAVKTIIAMAIVERWMRQDDFAEPWTGHGVLTPRGFLLTHNAADKGTVIAFTDFGGLGPSEGGDYRRISVKRGAKDFILARPSDRNFWPGWLLVNLMKERSGAAAAEPVAAANAGSTN